MLIFPNQTNSYSHSGHGKSSNQSTSHSVCHTIHGMSTERCQLPPPFFHCFLFHIWNTYIYSDTNYIIYFFQGIWFNEFVKGYSDHNAFPWIDNDMVANNSLCLVICVQVLTGVNWSGVLMQEYLCLCWYPVFVCNWEVFIVRNDCF